MQDLTNPKTINQLLTKAHVRIKKHLGQHFLISRKVLDKIIKAADLQPIDTVLEIGPGLGNLTMELAKYVKKVIIVEKDPKMIKVLDEVLRVNSIENVQVVNNDVLKFLISDLQFLKKFKISKIKNYKLVANLPYQITSPILWKFLHEESNKPKLLVILIQKEVADRLLAKPGEMSLLSVLVQYYAEVKPIVSVKRSLFYPMPQVDSTVVKLKTKNQKREIKNDLFFKLVKSGFANKRKTLKNNLLAGGLAPKRTLAAIATLKFNEKARPQELSVNDWIKLYKLLYNVDTI